VKYKDLKISELNFNKSEIDNIKRVQIGLYEDSARAENMMYMNVLNIFLGVFYYFFLEIHNNLVFYLHGIIFLLILRRYYFYKQFCFYNIKEYLSIIEKFLKRKKVKFERGFYLDSFNAHGGLTLTGERLLIRNDIDEALKKISNNKKWEHLFKIPRFIEIFIDKY